MSQLVNLVIDQGSDFVATLDVQDSIGTPIVLDLYDVRGQIRKTYSSTTSYDFTCVKTTNQGEVKLSMVGSLTASMRDGRYVYDVEIIHSVLGTVIRVVEGQVTVTPRVSRTPIVVPPGP